MIDILKRIFIGVAVGMSIFFLKNQVFAAEIPGRYVGQEPFFLNAVQSDFNLNSNSSVPYSINFNASNIPTGSYLYNTYNGHGFSDSSFDNGIFLVFRIESILTNIQSNNTSSNSLDIPLYNFSVVLVSSGSWSTCFIDSNMAICPISADTGNFTALRIYQPNSNSLISSYSNAKLTFRINNYADVFILDNYSDEFYGIVNWLSRIYSNMNTSSNIGTAIQDQTDDILDSDEPASATYNNDYSTTDFDSAESSMDQHINVDVSNIIFDPTRWAFAFSYIWGLVTSFVQLNAKVFATITGFLTLSFVGLVIGRS